MTDELNAGAPVAPQRWHIIVGVLGLLYGACGCCMQGAFVAFLTFGAKLIPMPPGADMPPPPKPTLTAILSLITAASGLLLIGGSVQLLRRRGSAANLLFSWSTIRLLLVAVWLVVALQSMNEQIDYAEKMDTWGREMAKANGQSVPGAPFDREAARRSMPRQTVIFALVFAAFPVFIGVLASSRRKRDEMAAWERELR